jgi:hypothetical protein
VAWNEKGTVREGAIVLERPLALPDGTQVELTIEPLVPTAAVMSGEEPAPAVEHNERPDLGEGDEFSRLPVFGMWRDRPEMQDSASWVRAEREQWQRRATRQD